MNKTIRSFFFFLVSIAIHSLAVDARAEKPPTELDRTFAKAKAGGLKAGMPAADVERILGKPHNADWEKIYYTKEDVPFRIWLKVEKNKDELVTWQASGDAQKFGVGHFFIIRDDKLMGPIPHLTSKDFHVLHGLFKDLNPLALPAPR